MAIRLFLADPSDLILLGLKCVLLGQLQIEDLRTARSFDELYRGVQQHAPDVIIFNERVDPALDVLSLVEQLHHISPKSRLIVLSSVADGLLVRDLFAAGVLGYLFSGDDLLDCIVPAIRFSLKHRLYLSPTANAEYLVVMQSPQRNWQLDPEARAVLRSLARGLSVNEIATHMNLPPRRVYWLRQKLRRRFGATTNEHLISRAVVEGFAFLKE